MFNCYLESLNAVMLASKTPTLGGVVITVAGCEGVEERLKLHIRKNSKPIPEQCQTTCPSPQHPSTA